MEVVIDVLNLDAPKVPETKATNVNHMVAANDALNQVAPKVPKARQINVYHMEAENDALNQDARRLPKARQINVYHMEAENDALNQDAQRVANVKLINVHHMEVANDVQIVSLGQIHELVQSHMMDIVQPVSSSCSPPMNEVRSFTFTQKKFGSAMQSMRHLKDSFMTNHYTQDNAIALIVVALIIGN
jgi:hypothetical protein